jgi:ACS family hexuronate transporter-like MFS transporter
MAGGIGGVLITKLGGFLFDTYRFSGISQSWVSAKANGLGAYVDKIRSMDILSKYGDKINLDAIDLASISKESANQLRNVDAAAFEALLKIQKPLVLAEMTTSYTIMFAICAVAYLIAWSVMKLLVPKMKLVEI